MRLEEHRLGLTRGKLTLAGSEQVRAVALAMAGQCRASLDIAARHLDPGIYDTPEFLEAVRQFVLRSRRARLRLLVILPEALHRRGHRLIDLAGGLSSFIQVRVPGAEHQEFNESILLADEVGYLHRPLSDRYEGAADFCDPAYAGALARRFQEVWDKGRPDPNFRRLSL